MALFAEHGSALYRFARVALHQPGDAEDVVQDTFVKALRHLRAAGDRRNLRGWLFTVTANLCRDYNRRGRRWLPWTLEADHRTVRADLALATDEATSEQSVVRALGTLAERDRLLLALRTQGLSYRDIASATGVAEGSVGRLLARALGRWRRAWTTEQERR